MLCYTQAYTRVHAHTQKHTPTQTRQSQMKMIHYNMPALSFSLTNDSVSTKVCLSIVSITCMHTHVRTRMHALGKHL